VAKKQKKYRRLWQELERIQYGCEPQDIIRTFSMEFLKLNLTFAKDHIDKKDRPVSFYNVWPKNHLIFENCIKILENEIIEIILFQN
jgi:hypothetical protein